MNTPGDFQKLADAFKQFRGHGRFVRETTTRLREIICDARPSERLERLEELTRLVRETENVVCRAMLEFDETLERLIHMTELLEGF